MAYLLVVDDDPDGREVLCKLLERSGYKVGCMPNGKEALMSVIDNPPDLVLLDLFMPDMDGGHFLEVLRSYLRLQSVPVILHTGLPDSPMVDRARSLGVNHVLVKGKTTFQQIRTAIEVELHRKGANALRDTLGDGLSPNPSHA
jgi:CheY-like chemotaxis protein